MLQDLCLTHLKWNSVFSFQTHWLNLQIKAGLPVRWQAVQTALGHTPRQFAYTEKQKKKYKKMIKFAQKQQKY